MSVWDDPAWELAPSVEAVGPFPRREFLRAVHPDADLELVVVGDSALAVSESSGVVRLAGDPELTDYHAPLGGDVKPVVAHLVDRAEPGTTFDFDSLPGPVASTVRSAFESAGLDVNFEQHAVTAVVPLGDSFDEFLEAIGKKQRHEVRRKRRRYEEEIGEVLHETHRQVDTAFDEFVRLHRLSAGAKGEFMSAEHEAIFRRLAGSTGWRLDMLRIPGSDRAAACLFSYESPDGLFLYNSAYDPELGHASPGIAIIGTMIETAIAEGLPRFDFLKGDEDYKFRLGAEARPLYRIVAVT